MATLAKNSEHAEELTKVYGVPLLSASLGGAKTFEARLCTSQAFTTELYYRTVTYFINW